MDEAEWLATSDPKPMLEYLEGPPSTEMREMFGHSFPITTYDSNLISERKARLYGVACCRWLSDLYDEPHCQRLIDYGLSAEVFEDRGFKVPKADCCLKAIELAERISEETVSEEELTALIEAVNALNQAGGLYAASHDSTDEYEHQLVATAEVASAIGNACSGHPIRPGIFGQRTGGAFETLTAVVWRTAQAAAYRKGLAFVHITTGGDPDNRAVNAALLRDVVGNPFGPIALDPAWLTSDVLALARGIYDERAFDRMPILADALQDAGCENADVLNHCRGDGPHVRGCWVVDLLLGRS